MPHTIVVHVVSPYAVAGGPMPYAVRQLQPPVPVVISHGYRIADGPVRLVPLDPDPDGFPQPHVLGMRPAVVLDQPFTTADGNQYDAQAVAWPSESVLRRVAELAAGATGAAGRPRVYRLTDAELAGFAGRTLRLAPQDLDASW